MPKTKIPAEYISDNPSLSGTDSVKVPAGTTAQRGTGVAGKFRFNTTLNKFEGYTDSWGEIGGSGGSALETDNFTGDDSTTAFTLSSSVSDEDNLIVFIDGVYQNKADYVASGTTLTLDTAPVAGRKIVVYHVRANVSGSNCILNSFSGNGSTTAFTLTQNPASENNTQVFIDGVYQRKSSYAVSGTTLTFDAAPGNGTAIEVMMFTQTDINTLPASFVSGLTEVTATGSDHLMVYDATDGALKKALASDLIETVGATPSFTTATITNTTTNDSLLITSTEDSSSAAPVITLKRNSGSPADSDYLGQLKFKGENDADQEVVYAKITGKISDASDGSEDGLIEFANVKAGSNNIGMRLTSSDLKLLNGTSLTLQTATPSIQLTDTDNNADAYIQGTDGNIKFFADDNGEAGSTEITFALDGTQRAKIDADGDFTATNVYAGGSSSLKKTVVNFPNTTSYPNVSTYTFSLSATEAPIGSWVILGVRISTGSHGGDMYAYLVQDNDKGNKQMNYVGTWYYNSASASMYYIGTSTDRNFTLTHGTIVATNANDWREVYYWGYVMDN
jgi:hypothetical protein